MSKPKYINTNIKNLTSFNFQNIQKGIWLSALLTKVAHYPLPNGQTTIRIYEVKQTRKTEKKMVDWDSKDEQCEEGRGRGKVLFVSDTRKSKPSTRNENDNVESWICFFLPSPFFFVRWSRCLLLWFVRVLVLNRCWTSVLCIFSTSDLKSIFEAF